MCRNDDLHEDKCFELPFEFKSEADYEIYDDTGFDMLVDVFNRHLPENWYVNDVIETGEILDSRPENCICVEREIDK